MSVDASLIGAVVNDVGKRDRRYGHYSGSRPYGSTNGKKKKTSSVPVKPPTDINADNKPGGHLETYLARLLTNNGPDRLPR